MQKKMAALLAAATLLALSATCFAATTVVPSDNTVTSAKIVDGTIATVDLANGAVTAAKIANSTITATQLAAGSVTATQLANGAVTDSKIGSINASKLFGQISTSRLRVGTTAGTVAAGNHSHVIETANIADGAVTSQKISGTLGVDKLATYSGVKIVHAGPADNVNTFNTLAAAVAASSDYGLIKLMPGYYMDNTDLSAHYNLTIEGSGVMQTQIGNITGSTSGHVFKNMTIANISTGGSFEVSHVYSYGSLYSSFGFLKVNDSQINGTIDTRIGLNAHNVFVNGGCIRLSYASPGNQYNLIDDVDIVLGSGCNSAIDVSNTYTGAITDSQLILRGVRIIGPPASIGLNLGSGANVKLVNSEFTGTDYGVYIAGTNNKLESTSSKIAGGVEAISGPGVTTFGNPVALANTQIVGPMGQSPSGTTKLLNCYDGNFSAITNQ